MPEISLTLLKDKIIKTDTIIHLLADKNEKITQLREKLKMLYHKYVNKVKECEVLQLKIDLCKIEHDPLDRNLKELLQKHEDLQEQYLSLTNSSEIRYQSKCMELEAQINKYNDLVRQKEKCTSCLNNKFECSNKKYGKISKELQALTEKYENSQKEIKNLESNNVYLENKYSNQLKMMEEGYTSEITNLQAMITTFKLSEAKLNNEILQLNNKLRTLNQKTEDCDIERKYEDVTREVIDDHIKDREYIKKLLKNEYVGKLLSPILSPLNEVNLTEIRGNEYIEDGNLGHECVAIHLHKNDRHSHSEYQEDFIGDTPQSSINDCEEIGDIWFGETANPTSDNELTNNKSSIENKCYSDAAENIANAVSISNENYESEIPLDIIGDNNEDPQHICPDKMKFQCLQNDLSVGNENINFHESSDFIANNKINTLKIDSEIINGALLNTENDSLREKYNFQRHSTVLESNITNATNEKNANVILIDKEKVNVNSDLRKSVNHENIVVNKEGTCNKNEETNIIKASDYAETTLASCIYTQSCKVLYLQYKEYVHKITVQSKSEKHTPVLKVRNLLGFETKIKRSKYNEAYTQSDNDNSRNSLNESETSRLIVKNMTQHPTQHIGIQVEEKFENNAISLEPSNAPDALKTIKVNKAAINESISILISEHSVYIDKTFTNLLSKTLDSQQESKQYFPHSVLNDDFLGFSKETNKPASIEKPELRTVRKRVGWKRMKAELFYSLVRYFNKKIMFNQTHFLRREKSRSFSSNFKNLRRVRMLRWKKWRELCLPITDTDSDQSKNLKRVRKISKCKIQPEKNMSKQHSEVLSDISEDEQTFRKIISEQRHYQRLFSNHQELEDFYNTSVDDVSSNGLGGQVKENNRDSSLATVSKDKSLLGTDKDDINSVDSGYVKSDSDNISVKGDYTRKRASSVECDKHTYNKKRIVKYSPNNVCDLKQDKNNTIINSENEIQAEKSLIVNINHVDCNALVGNRNKENTGISNGTELRKEYVTAEICSLLQCSSIEENEVSFDEQRSEKICDISSGVSQYHLFGSDCESIFTDDEGKSAQTTSCDTQLDASESEQTGKVVVKESKCNSGDMNKSCRSVNKPLTPIRRPEHSISMLRPNVKQVRKKPKPKAHNTISSNELPSPQHQGVSDVEDPLHVRLQQESLRKQVNINKNDGVMRTSFKRSNSLINRDKLLQIVTHNVELNNSTISHKKLDPISEKPKKLHLEQAKALLQKVLTFPDKPSIVNEIADIFSMQDNTYISRIIVLELSLDTDKADIKYTPPAPVLTKTQRIFLGFLVKLDQSASPGVLDIFMVEAEKYLLRSTNLQCIENVTRLYLAVCKLQRKIHRMRRMVCDAFYFMGDFSIPFLFTVLSTWIEVMLKETDTHGELIVKVIIEIVKQKKCTSPGYNLVPLKSLLKAYYGYNMEEDCLDSLFLEIFHQYTARQEKSLEYALMILFKNLSSTWISEKIKEHIEKSDNILLKGNKYIKTY